MGFFTAALCMFFLANGCVAQFNVCNPNPCLNGGNCVPGSPVYKCYCLAGFTGTRCQYVCRPVDVVFVVDRSGSMGGVFNSLVIPFINKIVEKMPVDEGVARIGGVLFSSYATPFFNLGTYSTRAQVIAKWSSPISVGGGTNIPAGINTGCGLFNGAPNHPAANIMIVITDGYSYGDPGAAATACRNTKNAIIFAVGLGNNVNMAQINAIANTHPTIPGYYVITAAMNYNDIISKVPDIVNDICKEEAFDVNCYGDIMKLNPTGASVATAVHGGLTHIRGVPASNALIDQDVAELNKMKTCYVDIGRRYCIHPALIAAIASRESRAGKALDSNGYGDQRKAYGIMQCDIRRAGFNCLQYPYNSCEHISMMVEKALIVFIKTMQTHYATWPAELQLQGGVSAYNHNIPDVLTWANMDRNSMGHDYSNDIIARAQRLVNQHGWEYGL